jgi:predicted transcriptional regulator
LLLKPYYHPCLSSLTLKFGERHIQGIVQIDFDKLEFKSTQFISSLIRAMLSGKHVLAMEGNLIAESGMAYFELEQARFDAVSLPNFLVSEIITTVGKRQDPPFDPMAPTAMPFRIQRVDLHTGHITIYQ